MKNEKPEAYRTPLFPSTCSLMHSEGLIGGYCWLQRNMSCALVRSRGVRISVQLCCSNDFLALARLLMLNGLYLYRAEFSVSAVVIYDDPEESSYCRENIAEAWQAETESQKVAATAIKSKSK